MYHVTIFQYNIIIYCAHYMASYIMARELNETHSVFDLFLLLIDISKNVFRGRFNSITSNKIITYLLYIII